MENKTKSDRQKSLKANIFVHDFLVKEGEYEKSPHLLAENKVRVTERIESILDTYLTGPRKKALDFGCGTGFVLNMTKTQFEQVHGVDISTEMMSRIDTSSGNVFLHEEEAERTSFEDASVDFASAYSFMDHLHDYRIFLREVYRVLRPGGVFYSDLNPNRAFVQMMERAEQNAGSPASGLLKREIDGALHNGKYYESQFGLPEEQLRLAEPIKSIDKGFDACEVASVARDLGFSTCIVQEEWFVGESNFGSDKASLKAVRGYLTELLPASSGFFKYLRFVFVK